MKFNSVFSNFQYKRNFKAKKMEIKNFQKFYCPILSRIIKTGEEIGFLKHIFKHAISFHNDIKCASKKIILKLYKARQCHSSGQL